MNVDAWAAVVVWPLMLLAAWLAGAWAARGRRVGGAWAAQLADVPRACTYGAVGLALSSLGLSRGVTTHGALGGLADLALALTLFELGYRINPRWFLRNPWVLVAGLAQAALTFAVVMWVGGGAHRAAAFGRRLPGLHLQPLPSLPLRFGRHDGEPADPGAAHHPRRHSADAASAGAAFLGAEQPERGRGD